MMRRAQPWLGTLVEIAIADDVPDAVAHRAAALAFTEIALVHRLMSFHDAESDVARLNRASVGQVCTVHAHTWQVLQLASRVMDLSQGIFNIACAPQLVAWAYLPAPLGAVPRPAPSQEVVRCIAPATVRKVAPGWIDLGGIAKGYAVDVAIAAIAGAGIRSACVNAGGDLRILGEQAFPITLRDPRDPRRAGAHFMLHDAALATSATYFSSKIEQGAQVSALIDGRDGRAISNTASVSICAPRCAVADALTKVVLATGDVHHPALQSFDASALIM